jgi:hypothetical protein
VQAITKVMEALSPLDGEAREHVLEFVLKRMNINVGTPSAVLSSTKPPELNSVLSAAEQITLAGPERYVENLGTHDMDNHCTNAHNDIDARCDRYRCN